MKEITITTRRELLRFHQGWWFAKGNLALNVAHDQVISLSPALYEKINQTLACQA